MAGLPTGAAAALSGLGDLTSILNATNSWNTGQNTSQESSWNTANNWGWENSWSRSSAYDIARSQSNAISEGSSWGDGYSRTYGAEASAQDILNAREANQIQKDLWAMQAAYNTKEAEADREFQATMSNTAYRRAVVDLLAAGLNPILAVGNMGASTPVGAMASSGLGAAIKANAYADSESYNRSGSSEYSKSASDSYSYGESNSKSKTKSRSGGSSSGGSQGSSQGTNIGETNTQLKDLLGAVANLIDSGGSASSKIGKNGVKQWKQATTPAGKKK